MAVSIVKNVSKVVKKVQAFSWASFLFELPFSVNHMVLDRYLISKSRTIHFRTCSEEEGRGIDIAHISHKSRLPN
jgi:hypothetical protein